MRESSKEVRRFTVRWDEVKLDEVMTSCRMLPLEESDNVSLEHGSFSGSIYS